MVIHLYGRFSFDFNSFHYYNHLIAILLPLHILNYSPIKLIELELVLLTFDQLFAQAIINLEFYHSQFDFGPRPQLKNRYLN